MPDLGRYALEVTAAYAVSLGVLAVLVLAIWYRGRQVKRELEALERRRAAAAPPAAARRPGGERAHG